MHVVVAACLGAAAARVLSLATAARILDRFVAHFAMFAFAVRRCAVSCAVVQLLRVPAHVPASPPANHLGWRMDLAPRLTCKVRVSGRWRGRGSVVVRVEWHAATRWAIKRCQGC